MIQIRPPGLYDLHFDEVSGIIILNYLVSRRFKTVILRIFYLKIAASMVACTFLSAPLMFISAKMITASIMDKDHTVLLLKSYEFDISLLSFIGGVSKII